MTLQKFKYSPNVLNINQDGIKKITSVDKTMTPQKKKSDMSMNHTQTEINTVNEFVPPGIYQRGKIGATVVHSPKFDYRFKRKNDNIIKKGDRLIQESNDFIQNLKDRALNDQQNSLKAITRREVNNIKGEISKIENSYDTTSNPYSGDTDFP